MKLNLKLISLMLILLFVSVSAVCAEDVAQTDDEAISSVDNVDEIATDEISSANETGTVAATATKEFYELQQQIWKTEAGSTIELDSDYINYGKRPNGDGITIDRVITIDGKGHTLDGNGKDIFYVKQGLTNVVFKNIIFINGAKNAGGAIFADDGTNYLTVQNYTFKSNKATTTGGAIQANGNNVKITNCRFQSNYAPSSGGAIRLEGNSATITNNVFTGNKAADALGGAINALGHNIKITGNTFTKNTAGRDGGAICIEGTKVAEIGTGNVISKNVFTSNQASGSSEGGHGGAISMAGENCEISYNNFTSNHAADIGGAIRWNGANSAMGSIIANNFESNDAVSGGAIYISGNKINIASNKFNGNKATTGAGGSINIHGDSATITENEITNSKTNSIGGGIYVEGKNTQIKNDTLSKCSAGDNGGGAYLTGSGTVVYSTFTGCSASDMGGGIYFKTKDFTVRSNTFKSNTAQKGSDYYPTSMPSGKIQTKLTATDVTTTVGTAKYIIATLKDANGNPISGAKVGFADNGIKYVTTDAKGAARYYPSATAAGTYSINVAYFGDDDYDKSNTVTSKVVISKIGTKLSVSSSITTPYKSGKYILAILTDTNGNPINGAKVGFVNNGKINYVTTNAQGRATYSTDNFAEGSYSVKVKYFGNDTYDASNQGVSKVTISKLTSVLSVSRSVSATVGSNSYVLAMLKDQNGNAIKGAKIAFVDGDKISYVYTDGNGRARCFLNNFAAGTYSVKIAYYGNDTYKASNQGVSKVTISKISSVLSVSRSVSAKVGSNSYVLAMLKDKEGNAIKGAKIAFVDGDKISYVFTDGNGRARCFLNNFAVGTYSVKIAYYGNATYAASNQGVSKVTISK